MPRFYLNQPLSCLQTFRLPEPILRHIAALRLHEGAQVILFNGNGCEYTATLSNVGKKQAEAHIESETHISRESPLQLCLVQAVSVAERMDYTVQKSVELGVSQILPIISARCTVRLHGDRAEKRVRRWQEIAIAACEQCGRNRVPEILPLCDINQVYDRLPESDARLLLSPNSAVALTSIADKPQRVVLMAGAEGGFSPAEESDIIKHGFQPVLLGPRILRTETAAVAAMSVMQMLWGDF